MSTIEKMVEKCVEGLGYELVELEFAGRGLLRVSIDLRDSDPRALLPIEDASIKRVAVEDCEAVNRQLTHVLTVEDYDYERLEVASPGLDRPLRLARDFERFVGFTVALKLRMPFKGRKHFQGVLAQEAEGKFSLELNAVPLHGVVGKSERLAALKAARLAKQSGKAVKLAQEKAKGASGEPAAKLASTGHEELVTKLVFEIAEIDKAHLVPVV